MARIPPGWNELSIFCRACGEELPPGSGPIRRGRHPRKPGRLKRVWLIDHPGCPGIPTDRGDGWVYVCTGCGPKADLIKVGSTGISPSERVAELFLANRGYIDGTRADALFFGRTPPSAIMIWGAYTHDRYRDERRVHKRLAADLVVGFGREVFSTPLPVVLDVLAELVSGMVEQFAWSLGEATYGYPARTNTEWFRALAEYDKKSGLGDRLKMKALEEKIDAQTKEIQALRADMDILKVCIARLLKRLVPAEVYSIPRDDSSQVH